MKKTTKNVGPSRKTRPALTPEAQENKMISLAVDLAERQLLEGTASSQVITHYLKLGSMRERREREKLEEEVKLLRAKTETLEAARRTEEQYMAVIAAMKKYSGKSDEEEYYEYED